MAVIYILISAAIMITFEFSLGLVFLLSGKKIPWVYKKFFAHQYRRISAFTKEYFLAWILLATIHYYLLEVIF